MWTTGWILVDMVIHHFCWEATRQGCCRWKSSLFLRDWLWWQDSGAYYEFSLEYQWASRPVKLQSNVATRLSDHIPWVYIETDGGNGREAFWKTLQCQIKPQQTTPDSVRSISHPLHVLTMPPAGKTYTLPLSCNFMHTCQHPKPLAPGGKTLNLKNKTKAKQT